MTVQDDKRQIDQMSHEEMARLYRFAPAGHKYFVSGSPLEKHFMERFRSMGGMTAEVSKKIGWEK